MLACRIRLYGARSIGEYMKRLSVLLVMVAVIMTGCVIVPEGGYYRGYYEYHHHHDYYDRHGYYGR